uniref:Pyroglutamyl-peptidase I like n=1 Tax=Scophthalmus maximus TaxID=52904 RepID=A0A8D2ZJQ2_SCOMX
MFKTRTNKNIDVQNLPWAPERITSTRRLPHVFAQDELPQADKRGLAGARLFFSARTREASRFGPFRQFLVNPSWRAAQGLKLIGLGERIDVCIKELPVSYVQTQRVIAEIWQTLHPKFVVHLGIARGSSVVTLEQTGKNRGYRDKDVRGHCPVSHCCVDEAPEELCSVIDMRAVSKQLKEEAGMDVVYSRDAGRYLCDFAYYCSLYHGQGRAALIHIPTSGGLASADRLVPLLQTLIRTMLPDISQQSNGHHAVKHERLQGQ